jgi:hypothetical protein
MYNITIDGVIPMTGAVLQLPVEYLQVCIITLFGSDMENIKCEPINPAFSTMVLFHPNGSTIVNVGNTLTFIKANAHIDPRDVDRCIKLVNDFESWLLSGLAAKFNIAVNGVVPMAMAEDEVQALKDTGARLKEEKAERLIKEKAEEAAAERLMSRSLMDAAFLRSPDQVPSAPIQDAVETETEKAKNDQRLAKFKTMRNKSRRQVRQNRVEFTFNF